VTSVKPPTTRSRPLPGLTGTRRWTRYIKSNKQFDDNRETVKRGTGKQITVSEGHQWPLPKGSKVTDSGGPFWTTKSYVEGGNHPVHIRYEDNFVIETYDGFSWPVDPPTISGSYFPPTSFASTDAQLAAKGTTAIARCSPTNSPANVATFLGELIKDGIPSLFNPNEWFSKTSSVRQRAKAGSDDYLNLAFGWLPLVNDITKFVDAVRHAEKVLAQFERDAGKVVRRQYGFPPEKVTTTVPFSAPRAFGPDVYSSMWLSPTGTAERTIETVRRQWFSGAFTYDLPADYNSRDALREFAAKADQLVGLQLTPEVLWELAPWSWAVDWFTNAGDVLKNVTNFSKNGLVLRYGYMMEHTVQKYTYSRGVSGLKDRSAGGNPISFVTETKKRIPASPFGFGVTWDGLSPFQLSIAAALGISRYS